jgi:hypothetical protein
VKERADARLAALLLLAAGAAAAIGMSIAAVGRGGAAGLGALAAGWVSACLLLLRETVHVPPNALLLVVVVGATLAGFVATGVLVAAEQRALRRLCRAAQTAELFGEPVRVVPSRRLAAFCAGLLRPRVYVTQGLLAELERHQLEAAVRHELAHARARAPLKSLLARLVSRTFFWLPTLRDLEAGFVLSAELAADEAAVQATSRRAVAGALTRVLDSSVPAVGFAGAADARIQRLLEPDAAAPRMLSRARLGVTGVGLAAVAALATAPPDLEAAEQNHLHALAASALLHRLVWERLVVLAALALVVMAAKRRPSTR